MATRITSGGSSALTADPAPPLAAIAAVVLAGGLSTRMGVEKAFAPLAGRPLIGHVIDRLRRQAGETYINVRETSQPYLALGRPLIVDPPERRGAGPLAGVAAALARAHADGFLWLVSAPCDAPFLPLDLAARLWAPIAAGAAPAAVAVSEFGLEPMFALWPVDALRAVEAALMAGQASPRRALAGLDAAEVRFEHTGPLNPFANLNSPADHAAAIAALADAN